MKDDKVGPSPKLGGFSWLSILPIVVVVALILVIGF